MAQGAGDRLIGRPPGEPATVALNGPLEDEGDLALLVPDQGTWGVGLVLIVINSWLIRRLDQEASQPVYSARELLPDAFALPASGAGEAPGWYIPLILTGMALAAILIAVAYFRKR